jgi:hypothetical protein
MQFLNKYICEKYIVLKIQLYAEVLLEEIAQIVCDIKDKIIYDDKTQIIKILVKYSPDQNVAYLINKYADPFHNISGISGFNIYFLTNNLFCIIKYFSSCNDTICYCLYKTKFSKNQIQTYTNILKDSVNISCDDFCYKYTKLFNNEERHCQKIKTFLHNFDFDIIFYNIKIRRYCYDEYKKYINQNTDVNSIFVSQIHTIIPKKLKQNIIIKYFSEYNNCLLRNINIQNVIK